MLFFVCFFFYNKLKDFRIDISCPNNEICLDARVTVIYSIWVLSLVSQGAGKLLGVAALISLVCHVDHYWASKTNGSLGPAPLQRVQQWLLITNLVIDVTSGMKYILLVVNRKSKICILDMSVSCLQGIWVHLESDIWELIWRTKSIRDQMVFC